MNSLFILPRLGSRPALVFLYDVLASVAAWMGAYWLRFNLSLPDEYLRAALDTLVWVVPLQAVLFGYFGLYRGIWRFASLPDLKRILRAVAAATLATVLVLVLFRVETVVPRSVLVLDPLLLVLFMGGARFAYRAWKDHRLASVLVESRPVLILGAGSAADFLLREFLRTPSGLQPVGVLDDAPDKHGRLIQGVPVLGGMDQVARWSKLNNVKDVILAMPSASQSLRVRLAERCVGLGLNVLSVPSMEDLVQGRVTVNALRRIDIDDLLGRDAVNLDNQGLHDLLGGQVVMVTGAGGSIGSELCRQLAHFRPSQLVLLEQGEFALYQIEQEMGRLHPELPLACLIGDIKDEARVSQVMREHSPRVVFHAAAYKHVPLMEDRNGFQALRNNVLGTQVLARVASQNGVRKFVLISTDKAVNPTNVMGASKRLAEMVCQAEQAGSATRFISVRFGNVLGSSGSVIPKFQKQIEAGGPVTVTHPEITRYFMSIPEAAQLVLQAGLMGQGGEIFVLDMGEPVRIAELARLMVRLSGKGEDEIKIEFTGLRPGEKLYEELLADDESTLPTPHPKLRVARASLVDQGEVARMTGWIAGTECAEDAEVRMKLKAWVPEYRPNNRAD